MQDFIKMAAAQIGVSEDTTRSATGGLLEMIQKKADAGDFQQLLSNLPGAADLIGSAGPAGGGAGGGLVGGLMSKASSALGGKLGEGVGVFNTLKESGLDMDKAGSFVTMFVSYLKEKGGADVVSRILGNFPELAKLAG